MAEGDEVTLYVSKGKSNTLVPDVRGKTREKAIVALENLDLIVGTITEEPSDKYAKGEVCRQSVMDKMVPVGTVVDLYISTGEKEEEKEDEKKPEDKPTDVTPPAAEKPTTKIASVTLSNLPKKPNGETVTVKLVLDGVCVYESDISSASGSSVVSFEVSSTADVSHGIDVYYDGAYRTTIDKVTVNG